MAEAKRSYQFQDQSNVQNGSEVIENGDLRESEEDYSSSDLTDSSEGEPGWEEEALKSGELFYVEDNPIESNLDELQAQAEADKENSLIYNYAKPRYDKVNHESMQSKTVLINVDPAETYQQNSKTTLLAGMLGIIILDRKATETVSDNRRTKQLVTVDALVPGSLALRCDQISLDDILISINDIFVDASNVEAVLNKVKRPTCLKLVFHVPENPPKFAFLGNGINPRVFQPAPATIEYPCVTTVLTPHASRQNWVYSLSDLHGVFYLTLKIDSETAAEFDDLLYSFPAVEAAVAPSKIAQIRGLFLTLSDLMRQSLSSRVLSTTLSFQEKTFHCAHYQVNTELLILCFPGSNYSLPQVHLSMANAVRLLMTMFGTLEKAFQPENKQRLDHMFHYFLYLNASNIPINLKGNYSTKVPGILQLPLPPDLQIQANSALAELEASDFDDGTSKLSYTRRLYSVCGSCLFYDGYLVANHLSKEDLYDVHLYCHNHNLLTVRKKERIGLLVVWRELHRWSGKIPKSKDIFPEAQGRYFLLIVGLKRSLLCSVLQLNGKLFPATHTPRPDTKYVDCVKAILINLEADRFFLSVKDHMLQPSNLKLVSAEQFLSSHSKSFFSSSKPPLADTSQSSRFRFRISSPLKFKSATSDSDDDKLTTPKKSSAADKSKLSSRASRSLFREKTSGFHGSTENLASPKSMKETRGNVSADNLTNQMSALDFAERQIDITAGHGCSLFCYMKFDILKGILIMPTEIELSELGDVHHQKIVENFRKYALILHQRLSTQANKSEDCVEEGILFQYRPFKDAAETKKSSSYLQYWVIGRIVKHPYPHEFYVCFHYTAPQSMVELAFKSSVF